MDQQEFDIFCMAVAELTSTRSKDPKTKVGSCIVKDKKILSLGYNGAPKNFPDEEVPLDNNNDSLELKKSSYMCHSELNAILNYRGSLNDLNGASIYVTLAPCHECVKALIQVGIKEIIYKNEYHHIDISNFAKYLAKKCNIIYRKI